MIGNRIRYCVLCCFLSCVLLLSVAASSTEEVYVGGMPFGVRFQAGEVSVLKTQSFSSNGKEICPAAEAGICTGDVILCVNSQRVETVTEFASAADADRGVPIEIFLRRGEETVNTSVTPMKNDESGVYQLGILLKDSAAGIGTVTFVYPDTLRFAGLGHGICDTDSGKLLEIPNGYITDVTIVGIHKGIPGTPGELKGTLESEKCGKLLQNCEVGVFGMFAEPPEGMRKSVAIAKAEEVREGKATILCTLDDNRIREYEVEVEKIDHGSKTKTKNYTLRITDPALLGKTGGIVQGMSGSPILQNGKLIGAVTHVLVNDPTRGYGIFIENMLDAAE